MPERTKKRNEQSKIKQTIHRIKAKPDNVWLESANIEQIKSNQICLPFNQKTNNFPHFIILCRRRLFVADKKPDLYKNSIVTKTFDN